MPNLTGLREREECSASELVVGMQCGGSDAFSGITANPVLGFAADLIVRAGGSVMFSEVTEVRDGIESLVARAVNANVGQALIDEMKWYDQYLLRTFLQNTTPYGKSAKGCFPLLVLYAKPEPQS